MNPEPRTTADDMKTRSESQDEMVGRVVSVSCVVSAISETIIQSVLVKIYTFRIFFKTLIKKSS